MAQSLQDQIDNLEYRQIKESNQDAVVQELQTNLAFSTEELDACSQEIIKLKAINKHLEDQLAALRMEHYQELASLNSEITRVKVVSAKKNGEFEDLAYKLKQKDDTIAKKQANLDKINEIVKTKVTQLQTA